MQPGYPNPHFPPQSPMQPPPPPVNTGQYPVSPPVPQPQAYSQPARPMSDIAPPQSYASSPPQPTFPPQPSSNHTYAPNTTRFAQPARPMSDIAPPSRPVSQPFPPQSPMQPPPPPVNTGQYPPQGYQSSPPQTSGIGVPQNIPVHSQEPPQSIHSNPQPFMPPQQRPENPFYANHPAPAGQGYHDNRMDDILQDVNRNVSRPDETSRKSTLPEITDKLKLAKLKNHTKKAVANPKPVMIIVLAAVTFISLALAAFFAFNNNGSAGPIGPEVKVVGTTAAAGDAIQAGGGSLVSSQEVEELSNNLKKQVSGFNESQDFDQNPLSDQALGL